MLAGWFAIPQTMEHGGSTPCLDGSHHGELDCALMTLLRVAHISKAFAGVPVLQDISWQIEGHRTIGLIGANGSGKSTLMHILSGTMQADSGTVERNRGLRLGYLTQAMTLEGDQTLFMAVREAFRPLLDMQEDMAALEARLGQPESTERDLQRYGVLLEEFQARDGYAITARVEATLFGLGFNAEDVAKPVAQLSGGQKNMAALARVLLQEPDLLLLDEPSNHLDLRATEWLEETLQAFAGTAVIIAIISATVVITVTVDGQVVIDVQLCDAQLSLVF